MIDNMFEEIEYCTYYGGYVDQKIFIQNGYYTSPRHFLKKFKKMSIFDLDRY